MPIQQTKAAVRPGDEPSGTSWSFGTSWSITGLPGKLIALVAVVVLTGSLAAPPQQQHAAAAVADRMVENAGEIVEVIVQAVVGSDEAERAVERLGGTVVQRLGVIDGFVAQIPAGKVAELSASPGVVSVSPNQRVQLLSRRARGNDIRGTATLAHVRRVVNADLANLFGVDGSGVSVGLVDTGAADVAGLPRLDRGPALGGGVSLDGYGHGTHLAGIIGGDDPGSSSSSFAGVANSARVVSVDAAADDGSTNLAVVLAALDFVLYQKDAKNIRVLNLSLGVEAGSDYRSDILAYAVERLWHAGIVVVVAAGNSGELPGSPLTSPATDPYVIAVGSVDTKGTDSDRDDVVHGFSPLGTAQRRVDVVAPGQSLVSLRAPGSVAELSYPEAHVGTRFIKGTGTSQAAAVVSGVVAALLEQRPNLTPDQVKSVLVRSADSVSGAGDKDGAGMVDLLAALFQSPGSSSTQTWDRATGPVPASAPSYPPPSGTPDCTWDVSQGPPPPPPSTPDPAADPGVAPACGWSGGEWSADGTTFSGGSWIGGKWTGIGWQGAEWYGGEWNGIGWQGGTWIVGTWTGLEWNGIGWQNGSWTGIGWQGVGTADVRWGAGTWDGIGWQGIGWQGIGWQGIGWQGIGWQGIGWQADVWAGTRWE